MATTTNTKANKFSQVATDLEIHVTKDALEANGFKVEVVNNLGEASKRVLEIIPKGSEVFTAVSQTLVKSGLDKELNESGKYVSVREKFMKLSGDPDKAVEMRRIGSGSDYTVGSVHAITENGQVVIASASGSQLPNYAYGASHVIWVVGAQKIVANLDEALERIENYTFHLEDERALEAYGANSSLNKLLIYRKETGERVTIILIKETVGF